MKSQNQAILAHLKSGKSITQAEAVSLFNCYRLGARIYDLKQQGFAIDSRKITKKNNNGKLVSFAVYSLAEVSA